MRPLPPIVMSCLLFVMSGCQPSGEETQMKPNPAAARSPAKPADATAIDFANLTDAEWRTRLTPDQYRICRERGTEASGSGALLHEDREGTYACAACGLPLFESKTKYDACGWPSFWDAIPGAVATRGPAGSAEAVCSRCDSHLGHLFNDGPPPTGHRY